MGAPNLGHKRAFIQSMKTFEPGVVSVRPLAADFSSVPDWQKLIAAAPLWKDNIPGFLKTSNQGSSSECAAYAMTSIIEYTRRKHEGVMDQIDPHPLYLEAKKIDGLPGVKGTTLHAVVQAAQILGLIPPVDEDSFLYVNADMLAGAIFRYDVVLCSFDITENWMRPTPDGWIPEGGKIIGGHAMVAADYNLVNQGRYIPYYGFEGSWDESWGWRGKVRVTPEQLREQFTGGLVWNYKKG